MSLCPLAPNPYSLPLALYIYQDVPPAVERPPWPLPSVQDLENAAIASVSTIDMNTAEMDHFLKRTVLPYSDEEKQRAADLINTAEREVAKINTHRGVCTLMKKYGKMRATARRRLDCIEEGLEEAAKESARMARRLWGMMRW